MKKFDAVLFWGCAVVFFIALAYFGLTI